MKTLNFGHWHSGTDADGNNEWQSCDDPHSDSDPNDGGWTDDNYSSGRGCLFFILIVIGFLIYLI